ncbi:hypothetical protein SNEBB_004477, partial [Seison nebaliae]
DERTGEVIPSTDGEYIEDDGKLIKVGRPRYRKDDKTNQFIPDESGEFIKTKNNEIIPIKQQQQYAKDKKGNFIPTSSGDYIRDKQGNFHCIGPERCEIGIIPSIEKKSDENRLIPENHGKYIIRDNKPINMNNVRRYTIDENTGNIVEDDEGEYIENDGDIIRIGKPRYRKNEQNQFVPDEEGDFIRDNEGMFIPMKSRKKYKLNDDDQMESDDDQGDYIQDDDGNFLFIGPKRYSSVPRDSVPKTVRKPKQMGRFIPNDDGELIDVANAKRYDIDEETGKAYRSPDGEYVEDKGKLFKVGRPRYRRTSSGQLVKDELGEYVRDDDGNMINLMRTKYKRNSQGDMELDDETGDYIRDNDGNYIMIGPQRYSSPAPDDRGVTHPETKYYSK